MFLNEEPMRGADNKWVVFLTPKVCKWSFDRIMPRGKE